MYQSLVRLIEYIPYQHRAEVCALGVLIVNQDNSCQIFLGNNLKKIKAIDPSCNINSLRDALEELAKQLTNSPELITLYQDGFGKLRIQKSNGYITFNSKEEFLDAINWVLKVSVEPIASTINRERQPTSRLYLEVKNVFNTYGWLAKPSQGISDHKIVPRFALALDEGLTVDFAVKNGVMNCIQTIDYRHVTSVKKTEAQAKLLTLGYSHQLYDSAQAYAVIAGSFEEDAKKAIKLAERVVDDLFIHESNEDMTRLLDKIAVAIGQDPLPNLQVD